MEQKEPSMEEILSSIRRILSNEEGDSETTIKEEMLAPKAIVQDSPLELTSDMVVEEPVQTEEAPKKELPVPSDIVEEGLISEQAARESTAKLSELAQVLSEEKETTPPETSLEGMVRSLLAPYLKDWLNAHLPEIVEKVVQKEVRRLVDKADLS